MKKTVLCSYHYDPMNRLKGTSPALQSGSLRFYCQSRIATEIQGSTQHSIMQQGDQLLAQQTHQADQHTSTLLATDLQRSVLQTTSAAEQQTIAYTPFGHHANEHTNTHLLGFNGERADPVTGHYLLGNGYRAFNPVLMRFNSPDSWSPFGEAGVNAYAYCMNNPVLTEDPSGHLFSFVGKTISHWGSELRRMAKNYFSGGINVSHTTQLPYRAKIKRGISVTKAYEARNKMREIEPLTWSQEVKDILYLQDLNTPYIPTLNLQQASSVIINTNNIPTHGLPKPIQKFVANTTPNNPRHLASKKIKNGNYDPKNINPYTRDLYINNNSIETRNYLNDLHQRAYYLNRQNDKYFKALWEEHFIIRRQ